MDDAALAREGIQRWPLTQAFRSIAAAVLLNGQRLASIKNGEADVRDWGVLDELDQAA